MRLDIQLCRHPVGLACDLPDLYSPWPTQHYHVGGWTRRRCVSSPSVACRCHDAASYVRHSTSSPWSPPRVLPDGTREVLCWSWSGPFGLQYFVMIFPWQPTSKHLWVGSFEHTESRLWMWDGTEQIEGSPHIPLTHTQFLFMRFQVCFNANLAWMEQTFEMSTYFAVRMFLKRKTTVQGKQISHPGDLCGSHRTWVAKLHSQRTSTSSGYRITPYPRDFG